jgi:predicted DsbA family dithiol-disulfide isomerase
LFFEVKLDKDFCKKKWHSVKKLKRILIIYLAAWCYIGKRRLKKGLSQIDTSNINLSINWYPFELDHGLPSDGSLLKMDDYKQKLGEIN